MGIESILGDAHGIHNTAGAVVRLAAMVGIRIGEDNLHAARGHTCASAWTFTPIVVPTAHHLDGELVHIVVVLRGGLATIERAVAFLVVGVAPLVPVLAQALITTVFHGPHGVLL